MFYSIYTYAHGKETPHWGLYNNFGIPLILVIMLDGLFPTLFGTRFEKYDVEVKHLGMDPKGTISFISTIVSGYADVYKQIAM